MAPAEDVTLLLEKVAGGDRRAPDALLEAVYPDLRRLAAAYLRNEHDAHTLQATALVHEAYVRLVDWKQVSWQSRAQFFAVAAKVMRRILVDHARARQAAKRDGGDRLLLDEAVSVAEERSFDLLALEDALQDLARLDARQARIVEMRFFGGLSIEETAHVLDVSETTVRRDWTHAKAWFQRELRRR
jgi:RNA polymerase sigma factor (TIGR02999 family)